MRQINFANGEYYHVYNRGVDKRVVFSNASDYQRFYESLFLFNDSNYKHQGKKDIDRQVELASHLANEQDRKPFVSIVAFCLLPNHFHLLLKQKEEGGISAFMKKVGQGYTRFFNEKNERTGPLFGGSYKISHIKDDSYLEHLPRYIHLNALDDQLPEWRDGKIVGWEGAMEALGQYRWSSHGVYMGIEELLPVVDQEEMRKIFSNANEYVKCLKDWSSRDAFFNQLGKLEF